MSLRYTTRGGTERDRGQSMVVEGLAPLQRALRRVDGAVAKTLRGDLRDIADTVKDAAKRNAPVGPRPKRSQAPPLRESIRTSVTQSAASVYSSAPHAGVQDRGGRVGRRGQTVLRRSTASRYMTKAVRDSQPAVSRRLEGMLDTFGREFEK